MAEKVSTRKELRQPDALQRAGFEARDWLKGRQKAVGIAVIVVLVVGLAAAIASYLSQRGERSASRELGAALRVLERPVLENAPPGAEVFKTQAEKDEAIVKGLTEFRSAHGGTSAAASAALPLGQALYRQGKHDEALAAYGDYLKGAPDDDPLKKAALEGQGYAYEAKGDLDKALSSFEQMARTGSGEFLAGMGLFHRGRILMAQGKGEEAAKVFQEVQVAHPDTAASRLASDRLAILAAQGVKPPQAAAPAADAGT